MLTPVPPKNERWYHNLPPHPSLHLQAISALCINPEDPMSVPAIGNTLRTRICLKSPEGRDENLEDPPRSLRELAYGVPKKP